MLPVGAVGRVRRRWGVEGVARLVSTALGLAMSAVFASDMLTILDLDWEQGKRGAVYYL